MCLKYGTAYYEILQLPDGMADENFAVFSFNTGEQVGDALLDGDRKDGLFRQEVALPLLQLREAELHEEGHRAAVERVHGNAPLVEKK